MEIFLHAILSAALLVLSPALGAVHTGRCGLALEDIPDPASDSCVAFFRCYNNRQFSIRCPLGQAFHFDRARCRPESEVDCPLQLQRFQAPAVPHYLRTNQAHHDREVEIRVIHVAPNTGAANNAGFNSGQAPVLRQAAPQQGGQILTTGQFPQPPGQAVGQQIPVFMRTANGQFIQIQGATGQLPHTQFLQPPALQNMAAPGVQGQNLQYPSHYQLNHQPVQGQGIMPPQQSIQGQTGHGQIFSGPAFQGQNGMLSQQIPQSQTVPALNAPAAQQNVQSANPQPPANQAAPSQVLPNPPSPPNQGAANQVPSNFLTAPNKGAPNQTPSNFLPAPNQGAPNQAPSSLPSTPIQGVPDQAPSNSQQVTPGQPASNTQQNAPSQLEGQTNFAIFSPSSDGTAQSAGNGK